MTVLFPVCTLFLFYRFGVLEADKSSGIDNIGAIKWELSLCLLGVMVLIYFALWRGIKSSGKASVCHLFEHL